MENKSKKKNRSVLFIIVFCFLVIYAFLFILLLSWGLVTSVRDNIEFLIDPFSFKGAYAFDNYWTVFLNFSITVSKSSGGYKDVYIEEMFLNSLEYALGCAFVNTFVTCTVAYCAAKFDFKICKILYKIVIVVMVLPIIGSLPAEVSMAKSLGIYGSMGGMYIMRASFLGMYFLIFAAIFQGIPRDFMEAGYIDGANSFHIYFNIMMPMVKDTFMTILLLSFIGYWNDYSTPLIYLPDKPPLALGLYRFNSSTNNAISSVPIKMAGCFFVFIPIFLIFVIFQDKLMGNLSMGGLKE